MYDLIGDIHGHADELVELLSKLGYREHSGVYQHPSRQVIFCGDFIDRGTQIRDVLQIARSMVEAGTARAVMGNHEYNAITFHTLRPEQTDQYFRRHNEHNTRQHQATLNQLSPDEIKSAVQWFMSLPVALDLGQLRVVHACWDPLSIGKMSEALVNFGGFTTDFLLRSTDLRHPLFHAVERVLKGPELKLPEGCYVVDKEGGQRNRIRIRWFDPPDQHTLASYSLPAADDPELSQQPVRGSFRAVPYDRTHPPVFIGHYWMPELTPRPLADNVACLDYSVAIGGCLCAYRFDGESRLSEERFVTVASRRKSGTMSR
jgi:hypothetical protein